MGSLYEPGLARGSDVCLVLGYSGVGTIVLPVAYMKENVVFD